MGLDLADFIPPFTTAVVIGFLAWLARNLIRTWLVKSVEHDFNTKLESIRSEFRQREELVKADLRAKEAEIEALRHGAISAMASRQIAVDKRRLESVDQLWSATLGLARAKGLSMMTAVFTSDADLAREAARNRQIQELLAGLGSGVDFNSLGNFVAAAAKQDHSSPRLRGLFFLPIRRSQYRLL